MCVYVDVCIFRERDVCIYTYRDTVSIKTFYKNYIVSLYSPFLWHFSIWSLHQGSKMSMWRLSIPKGEAETSSPPKVKDWE